MIHSGIFLLFFSVALLFSPLQSFAVQALKLKNLTGVHEYSFEVFFGGFHVAKMKTQTTLRAESYEIDSSIEAVGFAHSLLGVEGRVISKGKLSDSEIIAQTYHSRATWRGEDSEAHVTFQPDGTPVFDYTPQKHAFKPEEYDKDILLETIDPISLSLVISSVILEEGSCNVEHRSFSGRHRHDFKAEDIGLGSLPENDIVGAMHGLHKCLFTIQKIHPTESKKIDRDPVKVTVYLVVNHESSPPFPILIEGNFKEIHSKIWLVDYQYST